jgi:cyanophycin synthetase
LAARFRCGRYDAEQVLLEAMMRGTEYRLLVLDGTPIGAVVRRAPSVVGDGHSTVAELVVDENNRRGRARGWAGIWPITLDLDAVLTLRSQGLTISSVLPAGRLAQVHMGSTEGSERDADVVDVGDDKLAGVRSAAAAAAAALEAEYVSVEVITDDASVPLEQSGGAVIEVNTTPGIAQHYIVSDPTVVVPVATSVLRRLLTAPDAVASVG